MIEEKLNILFFILLIISLVIAKGSKDNSLSAIVVSGHVTHDGRMGGGMMKAIAKNHEDYSKLHHYDHIFFLKNPDRRNPAYWVKVFTFLEILKTNKHEWILWLDSDAIVFNFTRSIQDIINDHHIHHSTSLIFSGDSNVINTGVLLLRNSNWTRYALNEIYNIGLNMKDLPLIGMGYDNAAFSAFLGGCRSNNSYKEVKQCYSRTDIGYQNITIKFKIMNGDQDIFKKLIDMYIFPHVHALSKHELNSEDPDRARLAVHYAGRPREDKNNLLRNALSRMNQPHRTSPTMEPKPHEAETIITSPLKRSQYKVNKGGGMRNSQLHSK